MVNKLYRFQVNNFTVYHLYSVLCVQPKSSLLPSRDHSSPPLQLLLPPRTALPFGNHHTVFSVQESFFLCLIPKINFSFKDPFVILLQSSNLHDSELLRERKLYDFVIFMSPLPVAPIKCSLINCE